LEAIMDIASLVIQLLSGAAGGNLAGKLLGQLSLGGFGNSLAGLIGGGLGNQVLNSMLGAGTTAAAAAAGPDLDLSNIVTQILGGGAGGGVMMMLVGLLKQMFQR
jgi:hypothetical protein